MNFVLSARAEQELATIYAQSVSEFGVVQADSYAAGLRDTLTLLAAHPQIAREREELASRARAYRYKAHMIVYRQHDDGIVVIRLPHVRSDWINDPA